jgi:hypothetical protein
MRRTNNRGRKTRGVRSRVASVSPLGNPTKKIPSATCRDARAVRKKKTNRIARAFDLNGDSGRRFVLARHPREDSESTGRGIAPSFVCWQMELKEYDHE